MDVFNLSEKVVLITGASGGIGGAVAKAMYARGACLVLTDLSQETLDKMADSMDPERVLALTMDVTDMAVTKAVVVQAIEKFGRLDVAFANAGISGGPASIAGIDEALFERVLEVDLLGVWRTVRACLPHIVEARGHVLMMASIYAFTNGMINAPYAMAKAGVEMFGRALRAELAGTGTSAGVLYPGWVATAIAKPAFGGDATATEMVKRAFPGPLGKPIAPSVVAEAVVKGIEKRAPRIIVPGLWSPLSALRGVVSIASDALLDRDRQFHEMVRVIDEQSKAGSRI
ncbi:SDR family NAD(P)-dependent oxidoreductase [Azotobacter armeniacus]